MLRRVHRFIVVAALCPAGCLHKDLVYSTSEDRMLVAIEKKTCRSADGVEIVYSAAGAGETALVFIHGGLADRTFFDGPMKAFLDNYKVLALDLPGHGESGSNRTEWGIPQFGADVKAVVQAENLQRVILFGNSLGGPVAIETALLLPDRVIAVVGIDTFHRLEYTVSADEVRQRIESFRSDYVGSVKRMVAMLFHPDADPQLVSDVERRMQKTPLDAALAIFQSMGGYDVAKPARHLAIPLRAINGDIFPTDIEGVRKIKADFDAVVMKHTGHYPMLERPGEFNRHVSNLVAELDRPKR